MEKYDLEKDKEFFERTVKTLVSSTKFGKRELIDYFLHLYHQGKICNLEKRSAVHEPFKITGNESIIKNSPLPYEVYNGNNIRLKNEMVKLDISICSSLRKTEIFEDSVVRINFFAFSKDGGLSTFSIDSILAKNVLNFIDFFLRNAIWVHYNNLKKPKIQFNKLVELRKKQINLISDRIHNLIPHCGTASTYGNLKSNQWYNNVDKTSMEYLIYQATRGMSYYLNVFGNEPQIECTLWLKINDDIELKHYLYAENPEKFEERLLEIKKRVDDIKALVGGTSEKSEKTAA